MIGVDVREALLIKPEVRAATAAAMLQVL